MTIRRSQGMASLTGSAPTDTHAASLTGSDTHAASLTGSDTHALGTPVTTHSDATDATNQQLTNFNNKLTTFYSDTNENTVLTAATHTPASATNKVIIVWRGVVSSNTGASQTITIRLKESGTVLDSFVATIAASNHPFESEVRTVVLTNQSAAAHTYSLTIQSSTNDQSRMVTYVYVVDSAEKNPSLSFIHVDSVDLSGSDTHAASLTGSDTHAASLTGSAGSDTHAVSQSQP